MKPPPVKHLAASEIVLALDAELPGEELPVMEDHLSCCAACRQTYRELGGLSVRLESLVAAVPVAASGAERDRLRSALQKQEEVHASYRREPRTISFRTARWALGIAATVALCVWLVPHKAHVSGAAAASSADAGWSGPRTFEALGETFVALPYSNSELPLTAHVVQMRVPAASLNQAGVMVESLSLEASNPNRAVLADVLLGLDGEPLGVHVVEAD